MVCWEILRVVAVQLTLRTFILSFPTSFISASEKHKPVIRNNILGYQVWRFNETFVVYKLWARFGPNMIRKYARGQKSTLIIKICSSAVDFTSKPIFILAIQINYSLKSSFSPCILNVWQDYLFAWTKFKFAVKRLNSWYIATDCWFLWSTSGFGRLS